MRKLHMRFYEWRCSKFHREEWEYFYDPPLRILRCPKCSLILCIDTTDSPCNERH